jgi:hypothetical protein
LRRRGKDGWHRTELEVVVAEKTGKKAASNAGKTLGSKADAKAKTSSGSALSQTGSSGVTSKKAGAAASKTLRSTSEPKAAKSAAGSALSQRPSPKRSRSK